ncbi:hypothetical protein [Burkholderia lata]|uniref:hypothetical protein n=1 Tax=Burkholderia lata (strain ATCC 17760 / DSM 23089 / LMG 22485 / NCIMB 9086 / R18194 / 383) TaxID=482957 RepID=UPI001583A157|nr:hypothetical protein [Burkholderia lata]
MRYDLLRNRKYPESIHFESFDFALSRSNSGDEWQTSGSVANRLSARACCVDNTHKQDRRPEDLHGVNASLDQGMAGREGGLDRQTDELVAAPIARYDDRLRVTPVGVFAEAVEHLERMREGRSFDRHPDRRGGAAAPPSN